MESDGKATFNLSEAGDEWAVFSHPDCFGATVGIGPFTRAETPPADGVAFYSNDFALKESAPWLIPKRVERGVTLATGACETPEWGEPEPEGFARVFGQIEELIEKGDLIKSVPVVAAAGIVDDMANFARAIAGRSTQRRAPYYGYGMNVGGEGFGGATPELLLSLRKGRMHTMALAGTAAREDESVFAVDQKEIREHEYVVSQLVSQLREVGMVRRESRRVMQLEKMVHFHTPLYAELYRNEDAKWLVEVMHPTPALGPLPRSAENLADLIRWRDELGCPRHFGAPFGLWDSGYFHCVVAIRGLHWGGGQVRLPSGCGVIDQSRLLNEWRELRLKRESVKTAFGL